jgi:hypothetical protein
MTGGKPIAVLLRSISGVSAINTLVAFYDIHGRKGKVLFFCSVPDTTRDQTKQNTRGNVKPFKFQRERNISTFIVAMYFS